MKRNQALKALLSLVYLFAALYSFPQGEDQDTLPMRQRHYDYDRIFSTNHTNFLLRFDVVPGVTTGFHQPDLGLLVKSRGGIQIGWVYQINFYHRWGFQTGLRAGVDADNTEFFISKKYSLLPNDNSFGQNSLIGIAAIYLPLDACYYVPFHDLNKHWLANFKLGTDLTYGTSTFGTTTWIDYPTNTTLATLNITNGNTRAKFFASFHATAGINYILPNKKILNFQVIGNWSPLFRNTYHYSFLPGSSKEIDGSYTRTFSYIGFELNYILTNPYKMKKKKR
jgi:hypothetical protein